MNYLYDGSGNRVAMQATVSGTMTTTAYIGSIEEVQTTGTTTQTTTYYTVGGQRIAANVNGTFYYFGYDALGSQVIVLNSNGILVGSQLYGPYGNQRYSNGTLPTSIGFTGQRTDSVTGLDYYVARYYDPVVGVFLSVDNVQGNVQGMEPYTYVSGNPETMTDSSGYDDDPPIPLPPDPDAGPDWVKIWLAIFQYAPGLIISILNTPSGPMLTQHIISAIYQYVQQNTGTQSPDDSIDPTPPTVPPPPKSKSTFTKNGKGGGNSKLQNSTNATGQFK